MVGKYVYRERVREREKEREREREWLVNIDMYICIYEFRIIVQDILTPFGKLISFVYSFIKYINKCQIYLTTGNYKFMLRWAGLQGRYHMDYRMDYHMDYR